MVYRTSYEQDRIAHAKRIMKPFFLRRLKADVLTDLPKKVATLEKVSMSEKQSQIYYKLVSDYKERAARVLKRVSFILSVNFTDTFNLVGLGGKGQTY